MFRIIQNYTILILFFLSIITLISCDGRDRAYKSNQDVLREANLLDAFSEQLKFVPEQQVEIITDTLLSNGFKVKIRYHSIKNSSVIQTVKTKRDTIAKVHYNNFEAKLKVFKNNAAINNSIIDKTLFNKFETATFWKSAIMQFIWVDHEASTKDMLYLNTSFYIPNTDACKDYTLKINSQGVIQIEEKHLLANTI